MATTLPQTSAGVPAPRQVVDPGKLRRKGWILSIAAMLLATVAGGAVATYLGMLEAEIGMKQTVVVASEAIPARALIKPEMLTTIELPVKYLAPSYLLNMSDLTDGNTTALINIAPGEYVQQNMVSHNAGLEPGSRAVSIAVNGVTSVGNSVRQGNYVDVIVSYRNTDGQYVTEVLLQNIKVLAVNTLLPAQGGTGGQTYLPAGVEGTVKLAPTNIVTLELTPPQALQVTHAANFANELRLVIRRLDETSTAAISPVQYIGGNTSDQGAQLSEGDMPAPAPQPSANSQSKGK